MYDEYEDERNEIFSENLTEEEATVASLLIEGTTCTLAEISNILASKSYEIKEITEDTSKDEYTNTLCFQTDKKLYVVR